MGRARPSSRTRSPHTLKLNSEWSADGSTSQKGGGTLIVVFVSYLQSPPDGVFVPKNERRSVESVLRVESKATEVTGGFVGPLSHLAPALLNEKINAK